MAIKDLIKSMLPASVVSVVRAARRMESGLNDLQGLAGTTYELRDLILDFQTVQLQRAHPNPLNGFGRKCFSQSDEDGITLEILRRLDCLDAGTFAEFGVGDGRENNTLILKALGWRGFWVGGETLAIDVGQPSANFAYLKDWITLDNIADLTRTGLARIDAHALDVMSLDLDGNDLYLVEKLLSDGLQPKLFIVEYNAKFPPPIKWQIDYNPTHVWQGDDYFGASLASFVALFERHGYRLVCCNSHTGANAFFVHTAFDSAFDDVPTELSRLHVAPRYHLHRAFGHPGAARTLEQLFR
jgi:hypothetical protein